jgi:hypothetical protein
MRRFAYVPPPPHPSEPIVKAHIESLVMWSSLLQWYPSEFKWPNLDPMLQQLLFSALQPNGQGLRAQELGGQSICSLIRW